MNAEAALLGSLLIDPEAVGRVVRTVQPDHFRDVRCRLVFEAMLSLRERGTPTDYVLVEAELQRLGTVHAVGGIAFVASLCLHTPTSLHAEHYARAVAGQGLLCGEPERRLLSERLDLGDEAPADDEPW